jgi:hypothetical protein
MEDKELGYCAFPTHIKTPNVPKENRELIIDLLQLPTEILLEYITNNRAFFEELFAEDTEDK